MLLTIILLFSSSMMTSAEWIRTQYTYPEYDVFIHEEYYDGAVIHEGYKITTYEISYTGFISSMAIYTIDGNTPRYKFVVKGTFTNEIWDETYVWNGVNPPTDYTWAWSVTGNHYCSVYAEDYWLAPDKSKATVKMNTRVEVPVGTITSTQEYAEIETEDGIVSGYVSYPAPGVIIQPSQNITGHLIGTTGATSAMNETSGAGPYHRRSYIDIVQTEVSG